MILRYSTTTRAFSCPGRNDNLERQTALPSHGSKPTGFLEPLWDAKYHIPEVTMHPPHSPTLPPLLFCGRKQQRKGWEQKTGLANQDGSIADLKEHVVTPRGWQRQLERHQESLPLSCCLTTPTAVSPGTSAIWGGAMAPSQKSLTSLPQRTHRTHRFLPTSRQATGPGGGTSRPR